jgi:hypothetical protein
MFKLDVVLVVTGVPQEHWAKSVQIEMPPVSSGRLVLTRGGTSELPLATELLAMLVFEGFLASELQLHKL